MESYLICGTPRTGSTLLCSLLMSTGIAGVPESYFRKEDLDSLARQWAVKRDPKGCIEDGDFVRAAIGAGSSNNGVFAGRIMWGTMGEVVGSLAIVHPDLAGNALGLLNRAFGHVRFVYLYREDSLAQAVSWTRAEQTGVWHDFGDGVPTAEVDAVYDFDEIHRYASTIDAHNTAWRLWFASLGICPHELRYEDLDRDPAGTARRVLEFLQLRLPRGQRITAGNRRLADRLSARWTERYRADRRLRVC